MDLKQRKSGRLAQAAEELDTAEKQVADYIKTLAWDKIEEWQKDNEYILSGYRRVQNSWKGCVQSVFGYLHNETVNIHSHLWGAVLFLLLLAFNQLLVISRYASASWLDSVTFSIFLSSAVFCLTSSAVFHTVVCHSEGVHSRCNALDYAGIVVLIVGSFFPALYYAFYCHPHLQIFYLSVICTSGLGAAYIVLSPEYSKPTHRGARTKVFIALGLSAVIPVTHALKIYGSHTLRTEFGFDWVILSGTLYIVGALLYANRIPERFSPGTFDYFFASHQIFHFMVVAAALAHYVGCLTSIEHWHGRNTVAVGLRLLWQ